MQGKQNDLMELLSLFNVYVRQKDLNRVLGLGEESHEIAVFVNDVDGVEAIQESLSALLPSQLVRVYDQIYPEIELFNVQIQLSTFIFTFIFIFIITFNLYLHCYPYSLSS